MDFFVNQQFETTEYLLLFLAYKHFKSVYKSTNAIEHN